MYEIIRSSDLRVSLSHKAQTNYGTQLAAADLGASGKSFRPISAVMPTPAVILAREGPLAFQGHEWAEEGNDREILRDLAFSLNFTADSFLVGLYASLMLQSVASVQEGVTGHYTHTIKPSDPLTAAGLLAKVTSHYFEAVGPDATRRKAIFPSLAVPQIVLTGRRRELMTMAVDLVGSGKEDTSTAVTLPALTAEELFSGQHWKLEIGNKGGALIDYTERATEWALTLTQELRLDEGYVPNAATPADGRFRSKLEFRRRMAALTIALEADRLNTDFKDRVLNRTLTEVKITVDNGVVAGTGTKNHGFVFRIPSCRLAEAPLDFGGGEAVYGISIPANLIYEDAAIADAPFSLILENEQVSYLT